MGLTPRTSDQAGPRTRAAALVHPPPAECPIHRSPIAMSGTRYLLAILLAAIFVTLASFASMVSTAPAFLSLLLEPLSLFLIPGTALAMLVAGRHDFSLTVATAFSFLLYALLFHRLLKSRPTPSPPTKTLSS